MMSLWLMNLGVVGLTAISLACLVTAIVGYWPVGDCVERPIVERVLYFVFAVLSLTGLLALAGV